MFAILMLLLGGAVGAAALGTSENPAPLVLADDGPPPPPPVDTLPTLHWPKPPPSDWLNVATGCGDGIAAAVGDGIADDTGAIQACFDLINNESSAHHAVYLPAGTYRITATIRLFRVLGGLIVGDGEHTRLVWAGDGNGIPDLSLMLTGPLSGSCAMSWGGGRRKQLKRSVLYSFT